MVGWARRKLERLLFALQALALVVLWDPVLGQVEREQGPPYSTCGPTCQRQVKILEGFIVLVILGFAVGVGVCCLRAIDTPTSRMTTGSHHHGEHHYQAGGGGGPAGRSKKRD
jgi:hypothetical protein